MANTFTQLYVQYVFAVKGRQCFIPKDHKETIHRYIAGIIQPRHKLLDIHCMPDHTHILVGLHPAQSISELAKNIKTESTKFIKKQPWMPYNYSWQRGFGAFSYSRSQVPKVARYIENQEEHHKKRTFREEYLDILQKLQIPFEPKYLFEFYD